MRSGLEKLEPLQGEAPFEAWMDFTLFYEASLALFKRIEQDPDLMPDVEGCTFPKIVLKG